MKILINQNEYNEMGGRDLVELECEFCKATFTRIKYDIEYAKKKMTEGDNSRGNISCCSPDCANKLRSAKILKEKVPEINIISVETAPGERISVKYNCHCGGVVTQRVQDAKKKLKKCDQCTSKENELSLFVKYQEIEENLKQKQIKLKTAFKDFLLDKRSVRKITVECENGHISNRVIYNSGNECWKCSITGENSNLYKDGKCKSRLIPRIPLAKWKKAVYDIFGKKCFICESERFVQAHHILSYTKFPLQRENPYNGMPLCRDCHKDAHSFCDGYKKYDTMKFLIYIKNKAPEKYKKYILEQDFLSDKWFDNRWVKLWLLYKTLET